MRAGAIVVFVLAALGLMVACKNVFLGGPNRPVNPEQFAGYAVGSFLVPIALLALASWMWSRAGGNRSL